MDVLSGLTLAAPAGLNAYIPLLAVALAERFGWVHLREPFDGIGSWWVIGLIAVLLAGNPRTTWPGYLLVLTGVPVYFAWRRRARKASALS